MFELCKLLWDIVVLRDAARKGRLNWRIWPLAFGFLVVLYGVGISAVLLYEKHPQYKPLFIAALIFDALFALGFMIWAYRWQSRKAAERKAVPQHTKCPLEPREQVAAPSSTDSRLDINRALIVVFAMFCTFVGLAQTPAHAESLYKDPAGLFTVMLPTDWQTQQEPGSQMVSFFDQKSQAFVYIGVVRENEASTPTADAELEKVRSHLAGNCPQAKIQERGLTTLDGIRGTFFLVHCTNQQGRLGNDEVRHGQQARASPCYHQRFACPDLRNRAA